VKAKNGAATAGVGARGGGNRTWTDSDIGIASEDRNRISGALQQLSDSRNWSSTRDGFVRSVSTSTSSSISSTASGMSSSLTEAQSYTREARRTEEIANRLESQASYFAGNSAAGSLNLSQAYREWGLGELERNRDFYGNARFDDIGFQLSAEGQALQARFVASYADKLREDIDDRLVLAPGPDVDRLQIKGTDGIRASATSRSDSQSPPRKVDPTPVHDEVQSKQSIGHARIKSARDQLGRVTRNAHGASAEAADDVKKW